MSFDRIERGNRLRWAWIVLTILGLCRVPLPWPDYHVVGHQHGPDQACEYHEHLLRWHPSAEVGDSVSIAHWHWAPLRSTSPDDQPTEGRPDLLSAEPEELALAPEFCPALSPDAPKRWQGLTLADCVGRLDSAYPSGALPGMGRPMAFGAPPFAPPHLSSALLQRWNC